MAIYELDGVAPSLHETAWVAEDAQVIGRVEMGPESSVWHGCVLRGDSDLIRIGAGTNVQDASVLHADFGVPLTLEDRVSIGHKVMLHGCTIGDGSLIGINAVVLNHAVIGRECLIGANALVPERMVIPDRSLVVGSPAKIVRQLSDADAAGLRRSAQHYVETAANFAKNLRPWP